MAAGWRAEEIAKTVGGRLQGDANRVVTGAAGLEEAGEEQISFFHNVKYVESLTRTRGLSLSGRMIYPLASAFFVQWPGAAGRRRKAVHVGNPL